MVKLFSTTRWEEARMAKLLLDEHGIEASVVNDHTVTAQGTPDPAVPFEIHVRDEEAVEKARELLRDHFDHGSEVDTRDDNEGKHVNKQSDVPPAGDQSEWIYILSTILLLQGLLLTGLLIYEVHWGEPEYRAFFAQAGARLPRTTMYYLVTSQWIKSSAMYLIVPILLFIYLMLDKDRFELIVYNIMMAIFILLGLGMHYVCLYLPYRSLIEKLQ